MKLVYAAFLYIIVLLSNVACNNEVRLKNIESARIEYIKLRDKIKALENELETLRTNVHVCNIRLSNVVDHFNKIGRIPLVAPKSVSYSREFSSNYISKAYKVLSILYSTPIKVIRKKYNLYRNLESSFALLYLNLFPKFVKDALTHFLRLLLKTMRFNTILLDSTAVGFLRKFKNYCRESLQNAFTELYTKAKVNDFFICRDLNKLSKCCFKSNSNSVDFLKLNSACPPLYSSGKIDGPVVLIGEASYWLIDSYTWVNHNLDYLLTNSMSLLIALLCILYKLASFLSVYALYLAVYSFNWVSKQICNILEGEISLLHLKEYFFTLVSLKLGKAYSKGLRELDLFSTAINWLDKIYQTALESNPDFALIAPESTLDSVILLVSFIVFNWVLVVYVLKFLRITVLRRKTSAKVEDKTVKVQDSSIKTDNKTHDKIHRD